MTADHFGGEVVERSDDPSRRGEHGVGNASGDTEVRQLRAVLREHDVRGLYVPVHQFVRVERVERGPDLRGETHHVGHGEGAVALEALGERLSRDETRGEVGPPVGFAHVNDLDEVAVGERRGDPPLAVEPPSVALVVRELGAQNLERDHGAVVPRRPEDDPHSALAEHLFEPIPPQPHAGTEGG